MTCSVELMSFGASIIRSGLKELRVHVFRTTSRCPPKDPHHDGAPRCRVPRHDVGSPQNISPPLTLGIQSYLLRRYLDPPGIYITVPPSSPYPRFGTTGSLRPQVQESRPPKRSDRLRLPFASQTPNPGLPDVSPRPYVGAGTSLVSPDGRGLDDAGAQRHGPPGLDDGPLPRAGLDAWAA